MNLNTTATKSSGHRRAATRRFPARVLLNSTAVSGVHSSRTSANCFTRNGETIKVSFVFKPPPELSTLFVFCSDLNTFVDPEIVCSVDDLLLIRVNLGSTSSDILPEDCDYFVYRANASQPSIELLRRPHPFFQNCDVGLLPRPDGHYTVAVLDSSTDVNGVFSFKLHVFHSDTSSWSCSIVYEVVPRTQWTPELRRFLSHYTTTVITIGGQYGTMGWVDLWQGILLCEVLHPKPTLRFVPLPCLPEAYYEKLIDGRLAYPGHCRGISFIQDEGYLKFVHMEMSGTEGASSASFRVNDWTISTWSNKKISGSLDDWCKEYEIQASNIKTNDNPVVSPALEGLLRRTQNNGQIAGKQQGCNLRNLLPSCLTPCASGEDVVYLVARLAVKNPDVWMLAVDMKDGGALLGISSSVYEKHIFLSTIYCPSKISKYLHPKFKDPATKVITDAGESSNQADAVEML